MERREVMKKYYYIPQRGERVTLIGERNRNRAVVTSVTGPVVEGVIEHHEWDEKDGVTREWTEPFAATLDRIEPPVYFRQVYDAHVPLEKLDEFLSWFSRGIAVRGCLDLGRAGQVMYQPLDNCETPHWAYTTIHDRVLPEDCKHRFRVFKYEYQYDVTVKRGCRYCHATGMRTDAAWLPSTWKEGHMMFGQETVPCWVCGGTGREDRTVDSFKDRKEKEKAKEELRKEGWELKYRRGGVWDRGWAGERTVKVYEPEGKGEEV